MRGRQLAGTRGVVKVACKPIWSEGVLVTQHHFQQQDRYHEQLLSERLGAAVHFPWGITELQVDLSALATRQFKLSRLAAIWPDGASVRCGGTSDAACPEPRSFETAFGPATRVLPVFVGLAQDLESRPLVTGPEETEATRRYQFGVRSVSDVNDGTQPAEVQWARPNLRTFFGDEPQHGYSTIRVAELLRDATGNTILRDNYVPPVLHLETAPFVMSGLHRVLTAAIARQRQLCAERARRHEGQLEFHGASAPRFWLLYSINGAIPLLSHLLETPNAHPEEVYLALATLAGQLSSFVDAGDPAAVPKFDYRALGDVFEELFARVLSLLSTDLRNAYREVELERRSDGMYIGKLRPGPSDELFVAVKANMPEASLRERAPRILKIADWAQIYDVVKQSRHGVRAEVEWQPSAALPLQPGTCFLRVRKEGTFWNAIEKSATVALYLPSEGEWSGAGLSLYAIDAKHLS